MNTHDLKTWPQFFGAIISGAKTFEVRRDDRDFNVGDWLLLREWDTTTGHYTGRETTRRITYVLKGENAPVPGVCRGFVVLGMTL